MISIRPIHAEEIPAAKHVIFSVAYGLYGWTGSLEENIRRFDSSDEFKDMDNVEVHYFQNDGLFLAAFDDETLIGSGAIRKLDPKTAELKRMWLLESYHGQGIGYRIITQLFEFARAQQYEQVFLQSSPEQTRALNFYRRLGFHEMDCYNGKAKETSMGIVLSEAPLTKK